MKYNELQISSNKTGKRVGRGIAAGRGKTAGRGTKGQKARKSGNVRPGFEGGQNPLMQRIPKLGGFRSVRAHVENVYTGQLDSVKGSVVDNFTLHQAGITTSPHSPVKLIAKGDVSKKHSVKLQAASKTAIAAVEKAGGSFVQTIRIGRPETKKEAK